MARDAERKWLWRKWDQTWAPLLEAGLILLMGGVSLALRHPLLFASLGPTAYEQVEKPELVSSKLYNVVVGHWIAIGCGFLALWLTGAWYVANPMTTGHFSGVRVWACVLAVAMTTLVTLLLKARQPAAEATALLIAIGSLQRPSDAWSIALAVAILGLVGEPIRRMRLTPRQRMEPKNLKAA
ncbi:MAG TPA: HPP family protein [Terriglobales bacterium]|nr:HPP family protein [Terriglobales bacterium]